MPVETASIIIQASPSQAWQVLSDLKRLPEWYVPSQWIKILSDGEVREAWQFSLGVKTLPGLVLNAVGTVKVFDPQAHQIIWRGQAMGIQGHSCWQITEVENGYANLEHRFDGTGWLFFLSRITGRNQMTMQQRLENLKNLVETSI